MKYTLVFHYHVKQYISKGARGAEALVKGARGASALAC